MSTPVGGDELKIASTMDADEWRRIHSKYLIPVNVTVDRSTCFSGSLRGKQRIPEGVSIFEITATAHGEHRSKTLIAASDRKYYKVGIQLSGTSHILQDDREAILQAGDFALYSTDRPYTVVSAGPFRTLVLMFPHSALDLPARALAQVTATAVRGSSGLGLLVSPFFLRLAEGFEVIAGMNGARLVRNVLDLVTTVYNGELDIRLDSSKNPHEILLGRVHDYIEANLNDPGLTPGSIAAAHYISTRHLHALYRELGTTVAASIRERRLERCRQDLRDPVLAEWPLGAISARWGIPDSTHFSRIFRRAFGESPTNYRTYGAHRNRGCS